MKKIMQTVAVLVVAVGLFACAEQTDTSTQVDTQASDEQSSTQTVNVYEEQLAQGKEYLEAQSWEEAIAVYEQILEEDAQCISALGNLIYIYRQMNDVEQAEVLYLRLETAIEQCTLEPERDETGAIVTAYELLTLSDEPDCFELVGYSSVGQMCRSTTIDAQGVKLKMTEPAADGSAFETTYYYLEDGTVDYYSIYDIQANTETEYLTTDTMCGFITYNEAGQVIEKIEYRSSGDERAHYVYAYDEQGNLLTESSVDEDGNVGLPSKEYATDGSYQSYYYNGDGGISQILTYSSNDLCLRYENYDSGVLQFYWTYGYTDENLKAFATMYEANGSIFSHMEYNDSEQCVKETFYENGAEKSYQVHEYDAAGNCVRTTEYAASGSFIFGAEGVFDDAGNQTQVTFTYADGRVVTY